LDHSLHCASGDDIGELTVARTGETVNASGHDLQVWPETGRAATISGRSQYIRSRNDWGDWFGSDNSRPMYHFPIEDRYLMRNRAARFSENKQQLFNPPVAPPVYPLSETVDRFNDLFALNRFTSACSATVVRSGSLGQDLDGVALVCEPVHNLVHRSQLVERGSTYRAVRVAADEKSEFLRSSDPWFRPVRAAVGPDGMIWVVDMYRAVIEHPEWIPQAWQQQLDLRAGSDRGRVYRVVPAGHTLPARWPNLTQQTSEQLVNLLASESGTLRDMAQQELWQRQDQSIAGAVRQVAASSESPQARVHALWILDGMNALQDADLHDALGDAHPGVVRNAILLTEPRIAQNDRLLPALVALADHPDAKVKLQLALTLGESRSPAAGVALGKLVAYAVDDPWLAWAIVSSSRHHSVAVLEQLLAQLRNGAAGAEGMSWQRATISELIATAQAEGANPASLVAKAVVEADDNAPWVFALAAAAARTRHDAGTGDESWRDALDSVYERAKPLAADEAASPALRCQALELFGCSLGEAAQEQSLLGELLSPNTPLEIQLTVVERLAAFRDRESAEVLLSRWPELSHSLRDAVALRLVSNPASIEVLLSQLEGGQITPGELSPAVRQTLRQSGSQTLQARVNRVLGKSAAADQHLVQQYLQFQQDAAGVVDVAHGQELFRKHCAACHTPDATGRSTGPDLANLSDRSPRALTEAILIPNRSVEARYYGYVVVTTDGRVLTGTIDEEAGDTLTLSHADGKRTAIQRSEIDELRDTRVSLMPDGFHRELDPALLRDLVEYLRSDAFVESSGAR
jgi:putative heme-binding domain-containing protein